MSSRVNYILLSVVLTIVALAMIFFIAPLDVIKTWFIHNKLFIQLVLSITSFVVFIATLLGIRYYMNDKGASSVAMGIGLAVVAILIILTALLWSHIITLLVMGRTVIMILVGIGSLILTLLIVWLRGRS